jgi:hypothetical protein
MRRHRVHPPRIFPHPRGDAATHRSCERCSDDLKVARCRPPPWRCPRVVQAHPPTTAVAHSVHARMATRGGGGVVPPRGGCTVGGVRQPGPPRVAVGGPTCGPPVGEDATREELGVAQGDANDGQAGGRGRTPGIKRSVGFRCFLVPGRGACCADTQQFQHLGPCAIAHLCTCAGRVHECSRWREEWRQAWERGGRSGETRGTSSDSASDSSKSCIPRCWRPLALANADPCVPGVPLAAEVVDTLNGTWVPRLERVPPPSRPAWALGTTRGWPPGGSRGGGGRARGPPVRARRRGEVRTLPPGAHR